MLADMTDETNPEVYLADGTPFLTARKTEGIDTEDSFPF